MKTFGIHGFVNQLLVGLLVTIGFGGSAGLGTVWMRHRISALAETNRALQQQIAETERDITDTTALVEEAMNRVALESKNESMRLGLVQLTQGQVMTITEDPIHRLVARAGRRALETERESGGPTPRVRFQLEPAAAAAATSARNAAARPPIISFAGRSASPRTVRPQFAFGP